MGPGQYKYNIKGPEPKKYYFLGLGPYEYDIMGPGP